jgi:hypothetical protein
MEDFFSESKADLINKKTLYGFEKMLRKPKIATYEPSWSTSLYSLYEEYIRPNIFAIIVVILLVLFLTYRYIMKSLGCNSLGCSSLGCSSLGCNSLGCNSLGCNSLGCSSLGSSLGRNSLGVPEPALNLNVPIEVEYGTNSTHARTQQLTDAGTYPNRYAPNRYTYADLANPLTNNWGSDYSRENLDMLADIIFETSNPDSGGTQVGMYYAPLTSY